VEAELRALENATGIEVDLRAEGDLSSLSDSQKIVLFRVVQEALSNVRKHSAAGRVSVVLRSRRTFIEVTVTDDGCGFRPQHVDTDRLGLAGISERVRLLGGAVEIETSPGAGTTVRATLPQWRPSTPAAATIYAATS
jgi:signal transduction histidine kinase